jgi:hypothetical protein
VRDTLDDRLVFTYYFYWYDWASGQHFYGGGCADHNTYHPVDQEQVSWLNSSWHYREFKDMITAGIDVYLPVFWGGNPGNGLNDTWSKQGLGNMQAAINRLQSENYNLFNIRNSTNPIPKVGMFYDTTAMWLEYRTPEGEKLADLTNATHQQTFYYMIHDFFKDFEEEDIQQVKNPDDLEGPTAYIVWMYGAGWFKKVAQAGLDYCKERFLDEFGHTLLFVGTDDWNSGCPQIEGLYKWGTAVTGMTAYTNSKISIASLGPGFNNGDENHGAVCQVGQDPIYVPRSPTSFANNWTTAISKNPNWIVIETWNEFHEGTVICRTTEHGTTYIDINGEYSYQFHNLPLNTNFGAQLAQWIENNPSIWVLGSSVVFLAMALIIYNKQKRVHIRG